MARRLLALFLSFVMVFSFAVSAYAESNVSNDDTSYYEFDDVTDGEGVLIAGEGSEPEICETCGSNPCTCEKEKETSSPCEICGQAPCTCKKDEEPTICEVCNADPCICEEVEPTVSCETCGSDPCTCEQTVVPPMGCGECGLTDGHAETCSQYEAPAPSGCAECGQTEGHAAECSQFVGPLLQSSLYKDVIAAEDLASMYEALMAGIGEADELTADNMTSIEAHADELYAAIDDPTADDEEYYSLLVDMFAYIRGEYELNGAKTLVTTIDGTWQGARFTADSTQELGNGATVSLRMLTDTELAIRERNANFVIPDGVTVTFKGDGTFARATDNTLALIYVEAGGTLIIEGASKEKPLIIDGNGVIAQHPLIVSEGIVELKNAVIQNGKNRSVNAKGAPNGNGGGISITSTGSLTMDNCFVTTNTASLNGGGIYCCGPMNITNSTISYNRAASAETGASVVNAGRGGGFDLVGKSAIGTLENVTVTRNAAMYYGGGGQLTSEASLTMEEGTIFSYNEAILHGAGALHVTAGSTFTMNGGSMENNTAQTVGGAIHSSYTCVLNLNAGKILNNTANGRGGGVHINTGGALTLNGDIEVSGNQANNQPTGTYADLDATGDNWSNVRYEGPCVDNGYGGGILIDSGTCTVAGATIKDNEAAVGGGGIALVMLNVSGSSLEHLLVVNFTMTSGEISGNSTDGNGAGVYMMSNKAKENIIEAYGAEGEDTYNEAIAKLKDASILTGVPQAMISGGTVTNNTATNNGGGLYLGENTKFIISNAGDVSNNVAVDGAGVYVASGTAEIKGGTMSGNEATGNGGALYISGDVTMTDGVLGGAAESDANAASNGGALYVADGDVRIEHGVINGNTAVNGGAVYLAGDADTELTMESGQMNDNYASENGGAIYATSGTLYIGLQDCSGDKDQTMHTKKDAGRHHPLIQNNTAGTSGGGIAISKETGGTGGVVYFYCGAATGNTNSNNDKGLGKNVFMDGGEFHFYDGTNVGLPRDPDLVIVGGKLWNECIDEDWITLKYYATNDAAESSMEGLAAEKEIMNLPNAEAFWDAPSGQHFAGWTAKGIASGEGSKFVRTKGEYVASGDPVEILDAQRDSTGKNSPVWDGDGTDDTIHLYALWVDSAYDITYVNILNYGTETNTPGRYEVTTRDVKTMIPAILKDGYMLKGWYIYQDLGQNANWGYEPAYVNNGSTAYSNLNYEALETATPSQYLPVADNGTLELPTGLNTFGDITLIADYELAYSDLTIRKTGAGSIDENQAFIFHVVNNGLSASENTVTNPEKKAELDAAIAAVKEALTVVVEGDGSVVIKHLPLGTYTVTEDRDWSWRYGTTSSDPANGQVTLGLNDPKTVTFTNTRTEGKWLSGDWYTENWWGETPIRKKDDYIDPTKVKTN